MSQERDVNELLEYLEKYSETGFTSFTESVKLSNKFTDDCHYWIPKLVESYQRFNLETQIALVWSIEDVKEYRPGLTDVQCMKVLDRVKKEHDCNYGVTWCHLEYATDEMFPEDES
jgi:hypothetical protein